MSLQFSLYLFYQRKKLFDKNSRAHHYYDIRNNNQKTAMPKPIIKSHLFALNLRAFRAGISDKTGMDYYFFILIKHKMTSKSLIFFIIS